MTVTIRKAVPTDAATIAAFQLAMAQETEEKQLELEIVKPAVDEVFAILIEVFIWLARLTEMWLGA